MGVIRGMADPKAPTAVKACLAILLVLTLGFSYCVTWTRCLEPSLAASSKGWEILVGTRGDLEIKIETSGIAVRIEVPREFLAGRRENDSSFVSSDLCRDYYFYSVLDESLHYSYRPEALGSKPNASSYDPNAPYLVEIWSHNGTAFVGFAPPKFVWVRNLTAPSVAGRYDLTVYVAETVNATTGQPTYPVTPSAVIPVYVSLKPNPGRISGYVFDPLIFPGVVIKAKGIVYALTTSGKVAARSFVNETTGRYSLTGLAEGAYMLEGSAGFCNGTGYAYELTRYVDVVGIRARGNVTLDLPLRRGCVIKGQIKYTNPDGSPTASLDHKGFRELWHPWSNGRDRLTSLNYTVEAVDERGVVAASFTGSSTGSDKDPFVLFQREEFRYAGYPSTGTAYSGLPAGTYQIRAWVFGYIQREPGKITVVSSSVGNIQVTLVTGGLISGRLSFFDPTNKKSETPRFGEILNFGTATGTLYGGNILVSAYNGNSQLAALSIIEGTLPNGTTAYADSSAVRFYLTGFSESLNRTFSGVWRKKDYGLPSGVYALKVQVRGYEQLDSASVNVQEGSNETLTIRMLRQSAVSIVANSYPIITETSKPEIPWAFTGVPCPPYLRAYFHLSNVEVGYVETKIPSNIVTSRTAPLNFTGMNPSVREITFYGSTPNSVKEGRYSVKVFTYGYVQRFDNEVIVSAVTMTQSAVRMYRGLSLNGTVLVRAGDFLGSLTERVKVPVEVYNTRRELVSATEVTAEAGANSFNFTMMGLRGVGHFFYVTRDGLRVKDGGILPGTCKLKVLDFGEDWRYRQPSEATLTLQYLGDDVLLSVRRMGKIHGTIEGAVEEAAVPLSWVAVVAGKEGGYSMRGKYVIQVDEGTYNLTFSATGYATKTIQVVMTGSKSLEVKVLLDIQKESASR